MSHQQWKVGDKDQFNGTIARIHHSGPNFLVYATEHSDCLWYTTDPELASKVQEIAPEIEHVRLTASGNDALEKIASTQLARALGLCGYGDVQAAKAILKKTEKKLLNLIIITGRLHYLLSCMILVLFNISASLLLASLGSIQERFSFVFYVATCGSLGGFLSVSLNLNRLNIDPDAPWHLNAISGASRILIAMIGAIFAYFLFKADIILGIISRSETEFAVLALSLVAGFSETLVPNILRKVESQQDIKPE